MAHVGSKVPYGTPLAFGRHRELEPRPSGHECFDDGCDRFVNTCSCLVAKSDAHRIDYHANSLIELVELRGIDPQEILATHLDSELLARQ